VKSQLERGDRDCHCGLAVGLLGGFAAAVFAAQQVREARRTPEAQMAAEFLRCWNDDDMGRRQRSSPWSGGGRRILWPYPFHGPGSTDRVPARSP